MSSRNRELWWSVAIAGAVTAVYLLAYRQQGAFPAASGLVGHGIGVLGFILMLLAETLYSIRKRLTDARWGSTAAWLRSHIVMGLVGPYMVLLHTSIKFQGLAGLAMLLTGVVVVSGVAGRYLYTRLPRQSGAGQGDTAAVGRLAAQRGVLATWRSFHVPLTWVLFAIALVHVLAALYYATLQR